MNPPTFTVIAGANGSGKSTLTRWAKVFFQQSAVLVPLEDQLRRYPRSFENLQPAIRLVDQCVLFDNSTDAGHKIVGLKLMGMEMLPMEPLPVWAEFLRR